LTPLVEQQEGHPACKNNVDGDDLTLALHYWPLLCLVLYQMPDGLIFRCQLNQVFVETGH